MKAVSASGEKGLAELIMATHTGMTTDEFTRTYDRESSIGKLDKALDEATTRKWVVVDMKQDWKVIFPGER